MLPKYLSSLALLHNILSYSHSYELPVVCLVSALKFIPIQGTMLKEITWITVYFIEGKAVMCL